MSFGKMPIANGFLNENEFSNEFFFEMKTAFCDKCFTFQLVDQPDPKKMFHENYAFFSRQSKKMQEHFKKYADWVCENYLSDKNDPFVIEIGSNDGILLENFSKKKIKHLGIEPSANVAKEAEKHGVNTEIKFFNKDTANEVIENYGKASAILAANVMCHIPDLKNIAEAAYLALDQNGVLIFEDPYLGDMIEKTSYDQIYDEHVYIFSAMSIKNIFEKYGFELINLLPQSTHGGSMRYILAKKGSYKAEKIVDEFLSKEKKMGLDLAETYEKFKKNCEKSRDDLIKILNEEKKLNNRVVAYGATSKSTTILNYCKIGPELIEYISDTTPIKQDKFSPGMHIPVKNYSNFIETPPDTALLFAWNHAEEIMEKESSYNKNGGKWIVHVPNVKKF
jgi:methylation protein EvaC